MRNQPAFPTDAYFCEERIGQDSGLTKREYFAALAMQGYLASWNKEEGEPDDFTMHIARVAVSLAEALIARLEATT